jgi:lysophospholipase L1-like esterase
MFRRWFFQLLACLTISMLIVLAWKALTRPTTPNGPPHGRIPIADAREEWQEQHAEFIKIASSRQLELIFFGDSLTRGWIEHQQVWVEHVTPKPTGFFAIGGDTTNHVLWRIENGELDGPPPKLVLLLIGTNNRWVLDDSTDIATSIAFITARIQERVPQAKILVLGVLPQGPKAWGSSRVIFTDVNQQLKSLDNAKSIFVRDLGACLLDTDGELNKTVSEDGTHLTQVGYMRLANALGPIVRELLGEPPVR